MRVPCPSDQPQVFQVTQIRVGPPNRPDSNFVRKRRDIHPSFILQNFERLFGFFVVRSAFPFHLCVSKIFCAGTVRARRAIRHVRVVKSDGPEDVVFQSLYKGSPMRDNNMLVRQIKPTAKTLRIGRVNWQVLRKSVATWLKMAGADI